MASSSPLLLRLLSASVVVAHRAGQIIRDVMSKGQLGIVQKGINDLQTEADRSAQTCIVTNLTKQFPNVKIIGEEAMDEKEMSAVSGDWLVSDLDKEILKKTCPERFSNVCEENVVIWVDPLDGTSEYTQGLLDHVTVLIGVAVDGQAVGGIIHQPYYNYQKSDEKDDSLGRTIWGLVGLGAFGVETHEPPAGEKIVTTTRSHNTPEIQAALDAMKPDQVLRVGGAGHKVLLVLEGKAHAYFFPSPGCKKWDTCAPEAVLHSAGGKLTDIHGNGLRYHATVAHRNSGGVLATHASVDHQWYINQIPDSVKAKLPVD